jgi:multidrug efflux pump subunit AcrA (membrane-fusion protein)
MNKAFPIAVVVLLSFAIGAGSQPYSVDTPTPSTGVAKVPDATVRVAEDIKLPAKEPGVLIHVDVKAGSLVRAGQTIAKIDDREIQTQKLAAGYALGAALKKVEDDVDIKYSKKAAEHAKADLEVMESANTVVERAITEVEVRAARLNYEKMVLATEKAVKERELANYDAHMKKAEYQAAQLAIERRVITAPFDGVVEELNRKQEEWVNPGDTILRLFRMDTMHVEGSVDPKLFNPSEIEGCNVTVEVQLARGTKETFEGRIIMVSSAVRFDEAYNVRAEIANRKADNGWLLRDGLPATMTIHLGTGAQATESASRAK